MVGRRIAALIWPQGTPFARLGPVLLQLAADADIILVVEEGIRPQPDPVVVDDVVALFQHDSNLGLIYGEEPTSFFVAGASILEMSLALSSKPPLNIRELIIRYRDLAPQRVKFLPYRLGKNIGSALFAAAISGERWRSQEELSRIVAKLEEDDPRRAEQILSELGEACLRELRMDDVEWQLAWLLERLEDDRASG